MPPRMHTGSLFFKSLRLILAVFFTASLLTPSRLRAQEGGLAGMTAESFSKWLTGTEWKSTTEGKKGQLWFATPGIVILRWEFIPGVWDCRAVALLPDGKGRMKWRWNADAVTACTVTVSEDLKSLELIDGLLGKWTLQPSARRAAAVSGGRITTMGAAGFSAWLEKQSIRWQRAKLDFAKGGKVSLGKESPGKYQIVTPGVVEVILDKDRTDCLLLFFAPGLDGAMIYASWGVSGARVKGAPEMAVIPSPAFNDPAPASKTLTSMKKEEFEKWLTGTEWEREDGSRWYWFPSPEMASWRSPTEFFAFGGTVNSPGHLTWYHRADGNDKYTMQVDAGMTSGEVTNSQGKRTKVRLLARRMPFMMHAPSTERMAEFMMNSKVDVGNGNTLTFPSPSVAKWRGGDGKISDLGFKILGPGMAQYAWNNGTADVALISWVSTSAVRFYWIWGEGKAAVDPVSLSAPASSGAPGAAIFEEGVADTKAVPLKKPVTAVNALLVMEMEGGRTAGAVTKLSLTSLEVTTDAAATVKFNQTVGSDMKKALREVMRFQAIRQGGWPHGQKIEMSFADKYSPKDGPSAAVACALLLESAIRGTSIQPDFAVTGDMNADGSVQPIGGVAAKLRGATKGGCTCVAIPEKNLTQALDLALTDGAAPFLGIQVFSIATFEQAATLAVREDALLRAVMDSFTFIAKKVKADPSLLRNPDTVNALRELTRQAPTHVSARLLLALAEGKLPAALSPAGSVTAINLAITDTMESTGQELLAKSSLDRGKVAGARGRLQQLRGKLDKRTLPLTDAWIAWSNAIDRVSAAAASGGRIDPKLLAELKAATSRVQAEENRLGADADFREDLMR